MILARNGDFYGTTCSGGANGYGTVFRMTSSGQLTTLVEFTGSDGAFPGNYPIGTLIQAKDGNLYGTTQGWQEATFGTIYRVSLDGQYTLLTKIMPGPRPQSGASRVSGLAQGQDGNLYGTLFAGGSNGEGSIFRVTPRGQMTTVHEFQLTIADRAMSAPSGRLFLAGDGNLYGTTWQGGPAVSGGGAVYRLTPAGQVEFVGSLRGYTHNSTGAGPEEGIMEASDGDFYGAAPTLGLYNCGTIYRMTPSGVVSSLVNFTGFGPGRNGASPLQPPVEGPDGALYGSTQRDGPLTHFGTIFRVTLGGELTTLVNFTGIGGSNPGHDPACALIVTNDGTLYGTTEGGGAHDQGTIFRFKPSSRIPVTATQASPPSILPAPQASADVTAPSVPVAVGSDSHKSELINDFKSPDGTYEVSMVNRSWLAPDQRPGFNNYHIIVLSKGGAEINEYPTWRELTAAYWSPDGKYVAVNNLRSDMGGDQLWVFELPSGKVIKAADDATAKSWLRHGENAIEAHFTETAERRTMGKSFLSLYATGWQAGLLQFTVRKEEMFDSLAGNFDFDGLADPGNLPAITSNTFALRGEGSLTAANSKDLTLKEKLLGWWASAHHAYRFRDDGLCYAQGSGTGSTRWDVRDGVYYENDTPFDVVSLTDLEFVCRSRGASPASLRLHRVSETEAAKF